MVKYKRNGSGNSGGGAESLEKMGRPSYAPAAIALGRAIVHEDFRIDPFNPATWPLIYNRITNRFPGGCIQ